LLQMAKTKEIVLTDQSIWSCHDDQVRLVSSFHPLLYLQLHSVTNTFATRVTHCKTCVTACGLNVFNKKAIFRVSLSSKGRKEIVVSWLLQATLVVLVSVATLCHLIASKQENPQ
jgi:hypothetical protein